MKFKKPISLAMVLLLIVSVFYVGFAANAEEIGYEKYSAMYSGAESVASEQTIDVDRNVNSGGEVISVTFDVKEEGKYNIGFSYLPKAGPIVDITMALKIDGIYPFKEAKEISLPRFWNKGSISEDNLGNQYSSEPLAAKESGYNMLIDKDGLLAEPYVFNFTKGTHTIEVKAIDGDFVLEKIKLVPPEATEKYAEPSKKDDFYSGESVVIEGENASITNSYWITFGSDSSGVNVSPKSPQKSLLNFVGGSNWSSTGDTVVWETPELEAGYYNLAFSYKQDTNIGSSVYRWLKIDGKTPFSEAKELEFEYTFDWEKKYFADENNNPYLIYLDEGKHEISLTVTTGEIYDVIDILTDAVEDMSNLYVDITMVTGQTVDVYRDYDLFDQIPDMESRLRSIMKQLNKCVKLLEKGTDDSTSSQMSILDGMRLAISQMLDNKYSAQKYVSTYYSNYCSVSATLSDMQSMPLSVDRIMLSSPKNDDAISADSSFIDKILFSVVKFFSSFAQDYTTETTKDSLEIWVNWGRDQAQVLNTLIESKFVPEHKGVKVYVRVTNASMVQAVLSGKSPDLFLMHTRSEPVNLAMRGVLYNLSGFNDVDEVLERFNDGADVPYRYKGDLYALPDSQSFYLMYYRTDIFENLGLKVPETWEEFRDVSKKLSRKNLVTWIPYTQIASTTATNAGVGSLSLFPSMVMQSGLSLYTDDLRASTLTSEATINVFSKWTDYYTKQTLDVTMDFYNRFRTGTCPLGISTIATYTTLAAVAGELDGKWGVSAIPGTMREDGTIDHTSSGGGTSCGMFKTSENPELAWEFLKWWTDADTQLAYSNNVEAILGPTARVAVANSDAFSRMPWETEMKDTVMNAFSQISEVPEAPGSYYLARAIDHSFWNVVNSGKKPKTMLLKWGKEVDDEIQRKWNQYDSR